MPSVSVNGGWTFSNIGPMTTTFTPAPTCTNNLFVGGTEVPNSQWPVNCAADSFSGCIPPGMTTTATATTRNLNLPWEKAYFSPGIYCPSGWATMGTAARETNTISSSGVLTTHRYNYGDWDNPAKMLASILDTSETLAICCPISMTVDLFFFGGCYSEIAGYTPTEACYKDAPETDYGDYTKTFTWNALTATEYFGIPTGTTEPTVTEMITLSKEGWPNLKGFSAMPMVTIVHHQSDLEMAKASTAVTTSSVSSTNPVCSTSLISSGTDTVSGFGVATSTFNAAGRLSPSRSAWDGLGVVAGVSIAAAALGGAIIFL
ncbi:hypothetical protein N7466_006594 [Penicillium verhagenii]|uniref:uncharacterized protein n=1 Tax=Penicillium verhagenii TaxID=1562060 RepID=UPI002544D698|nr:uncharacterized protein N7466_006594 [Penicillium verhagenii]KAJ5931101.1 hypothetical protein N7466_006594 [Penicillium verhagenii]